MMTHSMNHQQAVDSMAVERYVLGEMTASDRQSFEEHYFNCPACMEAVSFASDFLETGREYALNQKHTPAAVPASTSASSWSRFFAVSSWFRPAPAFALAVFAALFGLAAYQQIELREAARNSSSPRLVGASVFLPLAARGAGDRGTGGLPTVTVDSNQSFELDLDLPEGRAQYPSYEGEIISQSGARGIPAFSLPTEQLNQSARVELAVPPSLTEGAYQLVIRGMNRDAKEKATIARYDFVLKFKN